MLIRTEIHRVTTTLQADLLDAETQLSAHKMIGLATIEMLGLMALAMVNIAGEIKQLT